jgi:hypothetical protein
MIYQFFLDIANCSGLNRILLRFLGSDTIQVCSIQWVREKSMNLLIPLAGTIFVLILPNVEPRLAPSAQLRMNAAALWPIESAPDRKTCNAYYRGHEEAVSQAHNCTEIGASACGGPDQCSCEQNERLVSWKCDEGTFNACSPSKDGHPRCP